MPSTDPKLVLAANSHEALNELYAAAGALGSEHRHTLARVFHDRANDPSIPASRRRLDQALAVVLVAAQDEARQDLREATEPKTTAVLVEVPGDGA